MLLISPITKTYRIPFRPLGEMKLGSISIRGPRISRPDTDAREKLVDACLIKFFNKSIYLGGPNIRNRVSAIVTSDINPSIGKDLDAWDKVLFTGRVRNDDHCRLRCDADHGSIGCIGGNDFNGEWAGTTSSRPCDWHEPPASGFVTGIKAISSYGWLLILPWKNDAERMLAWTRWIRLQRDGLNREHRAENNESKTERDESNL